MSMPFPGMGPYLEHPSLWTGVHTRLVVGLADQLGPLLRPRYVASVEERVYLEGPDQQRVPYVWVQKIRDPGGGTSVAAVRSSSPLILEVEELEVHEPYIEILDRYQALRVVTVLEVASPTNKLPGPGRRSYLAKRREILASKCHLVEIDLQRHGRHIVRVPRKLVRAKTIYDYLVCVNRWPRRKRFEVYARLLRERLPIVQVPLADPDPDVPLDVQTALEKVYEDGSYPLRLRYDEPCDPMLPEADQQWATACWASYRSAPPELFPKQDQPGSIGPAG